MPRKAQSDEDNEKKCKPKEQFKLTISLFDTPGVVDAEYVEFYINEETGKRKKLMYDRASQFKKSIQENLCENTDKLYCYVLEYLGCEPTAFARRILDMPKTYHMMDDEAAVEAAEDRLDAEAGEGLL